MIVLLDSFSEAETAYLQPEEEHTFPLPPGMRDVHPSDSLLVGWTPASGYRFRYPTIESSTFLYKRFLSNLSTHRGALNSFCSQKRAAVEQGSMLRRK